MRIRPTGCPGRQVPRFCWCRSGRSRGVPPCRCAFGRRTHHDRPGYPRPAADPRAPH
ncbi:hypothetical protein ACFFX0_13430 [Citricoccus parietis]|uniref:Uncharacterized protein n=1 Tax=Citricoccus parietis TaxID=592307 RepID=A0ABV5FZM9_9MICC